MAWIISLGKWDSRYSSIFLSIAFKILCECFYGMNNNEAFETIKFFKKSQLSNNILIHYFFNYLLIWIIWSFYSLYKYYISKKKEKNKNINKPRNSLELIQYDAEEEVKRKTTQVFYISFLIYFLWVLEEFCLQCFNVFFKDIDIWMIELFLYSIFNLIIFKQNIYKHQWLAIIISLGSIILKIISIIYTLYDENHLRFEGNLPILYSIKKKALFWGILFYIFLILIRASVNTGLKWLMEKIYTPLNEILMMYGFTGLVCSFICIILSSIKECGKRNLVEYSIVNNANFNYSNYICKAININGLNSSKEYLTNYEYYFKNWEIDDNWIYELFAIFSWQIAFFFYKYYSLKIIKKLSPAHFIFSVPIAFFFQKLINIFYAMNQFKFFETKEPIQKKKFWLDIGGDIITIIGLLIYLEIIVLNFCGFDYNIKKNIIGRASLDVINNPDETIYTSINIESINENDENDNENNNEINGDNENDNDNENNNENVYENANENFNENANENKNKIEN